MRIGDPVLLAFCPIVVDRESITLVKLSWLIEEVRCLEYGGRGYDKQLD